ncbi:MAG: prepilin-type N-terminal cleavage/methylation domain-containing protein [Candidatus Mcinerneyibacterium aminivorans]|uniref:Prepilin-type N-terminal cleavage/methylation domain-containing protein n=1 Tax=Candidatus Mcinerneyibacterium aminivorans TaxID=2703815 RepID=A0A5D0ME07_9BACT|nr:MAG: prepilin-type N-terminal cleavage/methylation domain-containing protein [Candidatus Mcinerneyibacterium aminivorans]
MNRKGFTLLELVTVIIIVGILAAAGVPLYLNYVEDAKIARAKATIDAIYSAERVHYQKEGSFWPSGSTESDIDVTDGTDEIETNLGIKLDPSIANDWTFTINNAGNADALTITANGKSGGNAAGLSTSFYSNSGTFSN